LHSVLDADVMMPSEQRVGCANSVVFAIYANLQGDRVCEPYGKGTRFVDTRDPSVRVSESPQPCCVPSFGFTRFAIGGASSFAFRLTSIRFSGGIPGLTRARTPQRLSAGDSRRIVRRAIGTGGVLEEYGAAGDVDDDAADPCGAVGGEEQGRLRDVFGGA